MYLNITIFYGKCIPATLDDFASECVHYNVNNLYAEGKESFIYIYIYKMA